MDTETLVEKPKYAHRNYDPEYKGEKVHPAVVEGPEIKRSCTDCICCIIFTITVALFVTICIINITGSAPGMVLQPMDTDGNSCGAGAAESFTELYFIDPPNLNITVCVSSCPSQIGEEINCFPNSQAPDCSSVYVDYITRDVGYLCIPNLAAEEASFIKSLFDMIGALKFYEDVKLSWLGLLIGTLTVCLLSFIYDVILKYCAKLIGWAFIFAINGIVIGCIIYSFIQESVQKNAGFTEESSTYMYVGIGCSIIEGILLLVFIICFKKIRLAINVIEASAEFITDTIQVLFLPFIFFAIKISFLCFSVFVVLCLVSKARILGDSTGLPFSNYYLTSDQKLILSFTIFGIFWILSFIIALNQYVLAQTCAYWYFSVDRKRKHFPITRSFTCALRYHVGSLALGSLIMVIVWIIQLLVDLVYGSIKKLDKGSASTNFCVKCLVCCINCFERFIRFINKHAYIEISISGKNFCEAAEFSFYLILRNSFKFGITHGVGDLYMVFGQALAIVGGCYSFYYSVKYIGTGGALYEIVVPMIIMVIIGYLISHIFMTIFSTSADAILHFFCADEEVHSEKGGQAKFCPETLKLERKKQ